MQEMVAVAAALKGSKLKRIAKIEGTLESVRRKVKLDTPEEVMALTAMFDLQCSGTQSSINELSDYFRCTSMEVMLIVPAVKSLLSKGYIKTESQRERDVRKMRFKICSDIFNAIIEEGDISPIPQGKENELDQLAFCDAVHEMIETREKEDISTRELFAMVERFENEHADVGMVRTMREETADTAARTWFYEMCRDFKGDYDGGLTRLNSTLKDIYDNMSEGAMVKKRIMEEEHPLQTCELIKIKEVEENDVTLCLSDKGIRLLLGEAADAFIRKNDCANKYEFLKKIDALVDDMPHRPSLFAYRRLVRDVRKLEESCQHIPAIANVMKLVGDAESRLLYYRLCQKLVDSESFYVRYLGEIYYYNAEMQVKRDLKDKRHILQRQDLIEMGGESFFDRAELLLTEKGKELFLEEDMDLFEEKVSSDDMVESEKIAEKTLFFDSSLERQLGMLCDSLQERNLVSMCDRLRAKHLPTGIAALFYGLPGTGKTESVMQIARATGRAVMHVDISDTKSCWFGESEKIIKAVFEKYRRLCKKSEVKPILLFNEADAVFSKRKDVNRSNVAQTENAIQNIILEEMENLDGILIATTNMADNLDTAFERRFLFKVRFDKPTTESKKHIWRSKLPDLTDAEATELAASFDFSGGEIDNIVRKATMQEVISGIVPSIESLKTLCNEEKIASKTAKVGF